MGGMAIRARGSHGQATLHQTFTVDALRIVLDDLVFCTDISNRRLLAFAMALCTELRDVDSKRRRSWVDLSLHGMRAVAFLACWPVGIVLCNKSAVGALLVLLANLGMAGSTIDLLRNGLARSNM